MIKDILYRLVYSGKFLFVLPVWVISVAILIAWLVFGHSAQYLLRVGLITTGIAYGVIGGMIYFAIWLDKGVKKWW